MNLKLNNIVFIGFLFLLLMFASCKNEQQKQEHNLHVQDAQTFICPMGCEGEKTYAEPGNCPVCKMKLQPVEEELIQAVSPNRQVLSKQRTIKISKAENGKSIKVNGYVTIDENRNQSVSAWFGGRIEKLYVKYNLQFVKKGDKILELYSPEINTIQEQHLFLFKNEKESNLLNQSREKLKLLGITVGQIAQLEKTGVISKTVFVLSPADGFVFFDNKKKAEMGSARQMTNTMNSMSMETKTSEKQSEGTEGSQIREGMYVKKGEPLFSINDLQSVWAVISVPSECNSSIKPNDNISVSSELFPNKEIKGKVLLTEQTFEEKQQRFIRARVSIENNNQLLKINSLVTAEIPVTAKSDFQVPASAVYRTGMNAYVWVKSGTTNSGTGIFKARRVTIGNVINGKITLINGIMPNEEIALHAGVLTDSETFINAD